MAKNDLFVDSIRICSGALYSGIMYKIDHVKKVNSKLQYALNLVDSTYSSWKNGNGCALLLDDSFDLQLDS